MRKFNIALKGFVSVSKFYTKTWFWANQTDIDEEGCGSLIAALEHGTY